MGRDPGLPPNDPPLWPWPQAEPVESLFGEDQLAFPCDVKRGYIPGQNCDIFSAMFWRRVHYNPGSGVSNPELYAPLLNSHLIDNYLDAPTATKPEILLAPDKVMPFTISPPTTPVLDCIRRDLLQLKTNLLNGASTPIANSCP